MLTRAARPGDDRGRARLAARLRRVQRARRARGALRGREALCVTSAARADLAVSRCSRAQWPRWAAHRHRAPCAPTTTASWSPRPGAATRSSSASRSESSSRTLGAARCLARSAAGTPSSRDLPSTQDPEPFALEREPDNATYAPLGFELGEETRAQWNAGTWTGDLLFSRRSGEAHFASRVESIRRTGSGAQLVVSTTESGPRLVVRIDATVSMPCAFAFAPAPNAT